MKMKHRLNRNIIKITSTMKNLKELDNNQNPTIYTLYIFETKSSITRITYSRIQKIKYHQQKKKFGQFHFF